MMKNKLMILKIINSDSDIFSDNSGNNENNIINKTKEKNKKRKNK